MKNYALKRLLQLIPILLAITFLSYGMMRIAGSDVVEQKMENTSGTVSQEMIDNARAELGLDKPFVVQYFTWLGNLLRGDMGTSYVSNKPVFSTFVSKLPATLLLTAVSILLTVLISIPLGIWSAVKQTFSRIGRETMLFSCIRSHAFFSDMLLFASGLRRISISFTCVPILLKYPGGCTPKRFSLTTPAYRGTPYVDY